MPEITIDGKKIAYTSQEELRTIVSALGGTNAKPVSSTIKPPQSLDDYLASDDAPVTPPPVTSSNVKPKEKPPSWDENVTTFLNELSQDPQGAFRKRVVDALGFDPSDERTLVRNIYVQLAQKDALNSFEASLDPGQFSDVDLEDPRTQQALLKISTSKHKGLISRASAAKELKTAIEQGWIKGKIVEASSVAKPKDNEQAEQSTLTFPDMDVLESGSDETPTDEPKKAEEQLTAIYDKHGEDAAFTALKSLNAQADKELAG